MPEEAAMEGELLRKPPFPARVALAGRQPKSAIGLALFTDATSHAKIAQSRFK
jgi:hypothetical protein